MESLVLAMTLDLGLVLAAAVATATPSCSWAHPGANPYRGDPAKAVDDFSLPDETRRRLKAMMAAHAYTDVALITRDGIEGLSHYDNLREMHSGSGQTCHGAVDRSAWSATREERGLVYCVDGEDTCVIVPTICNNVSLVTRRPAPMAEEPIDIEPAAGPVPASGTPSLPNLDPNSFAGGMANPAALPANPTSPNNFGAPGSGNPWSPIASGTPVGGGRITHPATPVPEPSAWSLALAGLVTLHLVTRLRRRRQRPQATKSGFSKPTLP